MGANDKQVGGVHYRVGKVQHWDFAANMLYLEGRATAYIARHQDKGQVQDIEKALHFIEKILEERYNLTLDWNITDHSVKNQIFASVDPTDVAKRDNA